MFERELNRPPDKEKQVLITTELADRISRQTAVRRLRRPVVVAQDEIVADKVSVKLIHDQL